MRYPRKIGALDHDVFGETPSKDMNVIDSKMIEHDVVRKPMPTFRHHALARAGRMRQAGFTLVEMLVVLAIVGLLVGLVAPRVFNQLAQAKVRTAHIQIESFKNALDLFFLDAGRYPTTQEGLTALVTRPANVQNWGGPYVKGTVVPKDPWNNPYIYVAPGQNNRPYDIVSAGPGGKPGDAEGGPNQIASW